MVAATAPASATAASSTGSASGVGRERLLDLVPTQPLHELGHADSELLPEDLVRLLERLALRGVLADRGRVIGIHRRVVQTARRVPHAAELRHEELLLIGAQPDAEPLRDLALEGAAGCSVPVRLPGRGGCR